MTPHFLSKELNFSPKNFLWANSKKNFWPEVPTYKTVVCVCSQFIGRVSRRCTPRSTAVWRAGWPVAVDTRYLDPWPVGAQRSVDAR